MADVAVSVVLERLTTLSREIWGMGKREEVFHIFDVLKRIQNMVDEAEKRRFSEKAIDDWLSKLEQTCHRFEELMDETEYGPHYDDDDDVVSPEQKKVCSFFTQSSCLSFRKSGVPSHVPIKEIRNVIAQFDQISKEGNKFNFVVPEPTVAHAHRRQSLSSIHGQAAVFGRERDREYLVDKLVVYQQLHLQILSLVGMAGIGKTALAQLVYNDSRVEACFDVRIWIHVSDDFDEFRITEQIIEGLGKVMNPKLDHSRNLKDCISGEKFLLVLDDVWTEDRAKWEPLKDSLVHGQAGSKILVTTRNERVARMMRTMENDVYHVGPLSDDACWLLLHNTQLLVANEEKLTIFDEIGKEMAKKCKGVPFAAKALGSVLRCKNTLEEWESMLHEETWGLISEYFLPRLLKSYNELSPPLRHCFSYCSVFPKDSWIEVEKLIRICIALGYLGSSNRFEIGAFERRGQHCFDTLAMHSLFQDLMRGSDGRIKRCKMNGIIHDFAQFLRRRRNTGTTCHVCDPLVVSNVEAFRSLFLDSDSSLKICGCLTSLRVLKIASKLQQIPQEMEKLINLTWLELGGNKLSREEAKTICKLYKLQFLSFRVHEVPWEMEKLINLTWLELGGNKLSREEAKTICKLYKLKFLSFCVQEVPWEIRNLSLLRHLDLSYSCWLTELPDSICSLSQLQTLNISFCPRLLKLPEEIFGWNRCPEHLLNSGTTSLKQLPEELKRMIHLLTLSEYCGGSGWNKLGWLKNLDKLSGFLSLKIRLAVDDDLILVAKDAREGALWKKRDIRELEIIFEDEMDEKEETVKARVDVLDALDPTKDLQELHVWFYNGSSLPDWFTSPVRALRSVKLYSFNHLSSLPPLGELPFLEEIYMAEMHALQFVGREFLGTTTTRGGGCDIDGAFPRLKELTFNHCPQWKEWEDITEEEEAYATLMPRLEKLTVVACPSLNALPRRLLGKLPSSLELNIMCCSTNLQDSYYRDHASSSQLMQS